MVVALPHHTRRRLAVQQRMPTLQSRFEFLVSSDCPPCSITWIPQGQTVIRSRRTVALLVRKRACIPPISIGLAGGEIAAGTGQIPIAGIAGPCLSGAAATMSVSRVSKTERIIAAGQRSSLHRIIVARQVSGPDFRRSFGSGNFRVRSQDQANPVALL